MKRFPGIIALITYAFFLGSCENIINQIPSYSIIYDGNGQHSGQAPIDNASYKPGSTTTAKDNSGNLKKPGFTFIGWNTKSDGSGITYHTGETIELTTSNILLFAKWDVAPTYAITYDANGADSGTVPIDTLVYFEGSTVSISSNSGNLVKAGSYFSGWSINLDGSGVTYSEVNSFVMPSSSVVLYAKWAKTPVYSIIYYPNNGIGDLPIDATPYQTGDFATILGTNNSLTNPNGIFAGWTTDTTGSGTVYNKGDKVQVNTANISLYAKWTPAYHVIYDANGGVGSVPIDSTLYVSGSSAEVIGNTGGLTKTNGTFAGWALNVSVGATAYQAGASLLIGSANITLYAKWTPTYNIIITQPLGATISVTPSKTSYNVGESAIVSIATNDGYSFDGWTGSYGYTGTMSSFTILVSGNTSIGATTHFVGYSVTLLPRPECLITLSPQKTTYNQGDIVKVEAVMNAGYTFSHWNGMPEQSTANPAFITFGKNFTINAEINPIPYHITFDTVPNGTITVLPQKDEYHYGDLITFELNTVFGYGLTAWAGDLTGSSSLCIISVTKNIFASAVVAKTINYPVTVTVVDENYQAIQGASVGVLVANNTIQTGTTDINGKTYFPYSQDVDIRILVVDSNHEGLMVIGKRSSDSAITVQMNNPSMGSLLSTNGICYLPQLTGRLNPVGMNDTSYSLYAENIAVNGGITQPCTLMMNDIIQLEDTYSIKKDMKIQFGVNQVFLLSYSPK
jgi:uncharacterized repeat protein (TIGR02543 family)